MIKQSLKDALINFILLIASMFLSIFTAQFLVGLIAEMTAAGAIEDELRALGFLLVNGIALFVWNYRVGEEEKTVPPIGYKVLVWGLMCVLQLIFGKLVKFSMYASGAAYYAAPLFYIYRELEAPTHYEIPEMVHIVFMLIFDLIFLAVILWARHAGEQKRQREREALLGKGNG